VPLTAADGTFIHFVEEAAKPNHLQSNLIIWEPGSITVEVGDMVKQGRFLGLCVNSGHSTEPHLHFHAQDRANFYTGARLPAKFVTRSPGFSYYE